MSYKPNDTYYGQFTTQNSSGAATNADSLPTGKVTHNGTDTATSVTITNLDTGRYEATFTISNTYAAGDTVQVSISATVGGVAGKAVLDSFVLDGKRISDLHDIAAGTQMAFDMTQAVPTSNTAQTVGDALNAARAQGFGKWVLSGTTLTLYASDGTTVVRAFTLDSSTSPTQRV